MRTVNPNAPDILDKCNHTFRMHELDEITCQRGESAFAELLCRVRTDDCTPPDIDMLKSREI